MSVAVEDAHDIQKATDGEIPWTAWIPPEDIREERKAKRSAAARERHRADDTDPSLPAAS